MKRKHNKPLKDFDVLVLEDDEDSREVISTLLTHFGATVHIAMNGIEGLAILENVTPQFIISDISMPDMDGWEFAHALKSDRGLAEIPIIALTAHNLPEHRNRAMAEGFHNFITKPITVETFYKNLLRVLSDLPELSSAIDASA